MDEEKEEEEEEEEGGEDEATRDVSQGGYLEVRNIDSWKSQFAFTREFPR